MIKKNDKTFTDQERALAEKRLNIMAWDRDHLSERQIGMLLALRDNPDSLLGHAVFVKNSNNTIFYIKKVVSDGIYLGTNPNSDVWVDCKPYWDIEPINDAFLPSEKTLKAYISLTFPKIIEKVRATEKAKLGQKEKTAKMNIQKNTAENKQLKEYIQELSLLQTGISQEPLTKEDILAKLEEVKKIKAIKQAFITTGGMLVFETKMLTARIEKDSLNEFKDKEIGSFIIALPLQGTTGERVQNQTHTFISCSDCNGDDEHNFEDHIYDLYDHPNISDGAVCMGENNTAIFSMKNAGNYYQLVNFILIFLTTFPHDLNEPHIDYERWLEKVIPYSRPRIVKHYDNERIWELYSEKVTIDKREVEKLAKILATNPEVTKERDEPFMSLILNQSRYAMNGIPLTLDNISNAYVSISREEREESNEGNA